MAGALDMFFAVGTDDEIMPSATTTIDIQNDPDSKVHVANMGPICVLSHPRWSPPRWPHGPCYQGMFSNMLWRVTSIALCIWLDVFLWFCTYVFCVTVTTGMSKWITRFNWEPKMKTKERNKVQRNAANISWKKLWVVSLKTFYMWIKINPHKTRLESHIPVDSR